MRVIEGDEIRIFLLTPVVLSIDFIQMGYYFVFESVWGINKNQITLIRKKFDSSIKLLLINQKYSKKAQKEIFKWYKI